MKNLISTAHFVGNSTSVTSGSIVNIRKNDNCKNFQTFFQKL